MCAFLLLLCFGSKFENINESTLKPKKMKHNITLIDLITRIFYLSDMILMTSVQL